MGIADQKADVGITSAKSSTVVDLICTCGTGAGANTVQSTLERFELPIALLGYGYRLNLHKSRAFRFSKSHQVTLPVLTGVLTHSRLAGGVVAVIGAG